MTGPTSRSQTPRKTWPPRSRKPEAPVVLSLSISAWRSRSTPKHVPITPVGRHHFSGQPLVDGFSVLALLIDATPFGRMMGNVYLRIARPGIPTQLFADESKAVEWLKSHRA